MNVLVLIPVKPNLNHELKKQCQYLAAQMLQSCGSSVTLVINTGGPGDAHVRTLEERVEHTMTIRNDLVADNLEAHHTHVMWIDADVVQYAPMLPVRLAHTSNRLNAITAPAVYLHKKYVFPPEPGAAPSRRFYDIAGFVKYGRRFHIGFPYYAGQTEADVLVPVEGVGCVYCVPADVYRRGAKHEPRPGFTDHLAVCQFAQQRMNVRSFVDFSLSVEHAYLPDYGEALH